MTIEPAGKTAFGHGCRPRIGAAIAADLAGAGVNVTLLARTADQLDPTAAAIKATRPNSDVDLSDR